MKRRTLLAIVLCLVACSAMLAAGGNPPDKQSAKTGSETVGGMPPKATAMCVDGSWSAAEHRQGACSGHGGIKTWFGKPPKDATARCKDGTYSKAQDPHGACSGHGGVAFKLNQSSPKN